MFIRNYTVDMHLQNTGIGCAWYELDPTTGSLLSNMQAPNRTAVYFVKDFLPHSHAAWNNQSTHAAHRGVSIIVNQIRDFTVDATGNAYFMIDVKRVQLFNYSHWWWGEWQEYNNEFTQVLCRLNTTEVTCTNGLSQLSPDQISRAEALNLSPSAPQSLRPSRCIVVEDHIHCQWRDRGSGGCGDTYMGENVFALSKWPLDFASGDFADGTVVLSFLYIFRFFHRPQRQRQVL